jgi:hypothetical protein
MEFEQTYRMFCSEIPDSCSGYFFSKDVLHESVYHFLCYWPLIESLESFVDSTTYNTLVGSFKTLGELHENSSARLSHF